MKTIQLILSLALILAVSSQILAIDFGTEYVKASLVHTGAGKTFSIVENPKSQRKFINSLGFYAEQRFYQAESLTKRSRGPTNCIIYSKFLIDFHTSPNALTTIKKDYVLQFIGNPEADQLLVHYILNGFPEESNQISLLEAVGMIFKYVKIQGEKLAKGVLKDAVLVVPNYWNIHQRKFLVQAAQLADLYVLSLLHENTGAAINYALSQRSTNSTQTILFYNLGANSLQMTLAQFDQEKGQKSKPIEAIFILGQYGVPNVGGLQLDLLLAKHFAAKFQEKHKKPLTQRAMIRLIAECQKTKFVLSANKQAKIFIEGILEGIDFSSSITRSELQKVAEPLFANLTAPIKRFLFDHDLKAEELTAVELIGGGSRVPKLQSLIGEAVSNISLVGSHINGDEAMVLGAAFYGANSSKKFKVKGMHLYDGFDFEMRIVLRNLQEGIDEDSRRYYFKNVTLFKRKSRFGLTKEVTFKCHENLIVQIFKQDSTGLQLVSSYNLSSIKQINQSDFKVSITFEIHPVTVLNIHSVKYLFSKTIQQPYTEKVRKVVPRNNTEDESETEENEQNKTVLTKEGEEAAKGQTSVKGQTQESEKAQSTEDIPQPSQNQRKQDQEGEGQASSEEKTKNETKPAKKKKKKDKVVYELVEKIKQVTKNFEEDLPFNVTYSVFSESKEYTESKQLLSKFQAKEKEKHALAEAKNKFEALIYQTKDRLENQEFSQFLQEKERSILQQLAQENAEWFQNNFQASLTAFQDQSKILSDPLDKVKKRMVQYRERQDVKKRALSIIKQYADLTLKIQKGKEWITDQQVAELTAKLNEAQSQIEKLHTKIQQTPMNQDSVIKNKDLIKTADAAKEQYFLLKGKAKPKGWRSPKEEAEQKQQTKQTKEQANKQQEKVNEDEL